MAFLSVPLIYSPLINFQSLNHHWSVVLDKIQLQLDREEAKEREDGERGGEGAISIEGGDYFKEFPSKGGDYSREAINLSSDGYYLRKYSKHLF